MGLFNANWKSQEIKARARKGRPLKPVEQKFLEVLKWRDSVPYEKRELMHNYICYLKEHRKDPDNITDAADRAWAELGDYHQHREFFGFALLDEDDEDQLVDYLRYKELDEEDED